MAVNNAVRMALCIECSPAVQEVPGSIPDCVASIASRSGPSLLSSGCSPTLYAEDVVALVKPLQYNRKIKRTEVCLFKNLKRSKAYSRNRQDWSKKTNWIEVKRTEAVFLKLLWSPGMDSKELIPPAYSLACPYNPILTQFLALLDCSKVPAPCLYF